MEVSTSGASTYGTYKGRRPMVQCDHCGCRGHTKDQCYKIVGYPTDFKSKRKSLSLGRFDNQVELSQSLESEAQSTKVQQTGALFTQDQYQQILQLLSKPGGETTSTPPARVASIDAVLEAVFPDVESLGEPSVTLISTTNSAVPALSIHTEPTPDVSTTIERARRSTRQSKPPIWLHDFVTTSKGNECAYPITNQLSYSQLSQAYSQFVGYDIVIVLMYVDDLIVTGSNLKLLCDTRQEIQKKF
uniref:Reverse transcriptase Ty1/copia-type domain-containing protein n=1 Tax=Solanum lycopersicum TaxID=4081 RepID=A0A3Q7IG88_SOLLC